MNNRHAKSLNYALSVLKQDKYKKYLKTIYLYGSCARKQQTYNSDVDLFIQGDIPHELILKLKTEVTPKDYTLPEVELKFADEVLSSRQFKENIEKDGVLLWKK